MKASNLIKILIQIGAALFLGVVPIFLTEFFSSVFSMGWHFLTLLYLLIFAAQISFYVFTSYHKLGFSFLGFALNFVLWISELVNLDKIMPPDFFYQSSLNTNIVYFSSFLWALNKLIIDQIFIFFKVKFYPLNRIERIFFSGEE